MAIRFSGGTLLLDRSDVRGAVFDPRVNLWRAPAHLYARIASEEEVRTRWPPEPRDWDHVALRPYQDEALRRWQRAKSRGIVALPTGAGKTRIAIAALLASGVPTLILCPTRALLHDWVTQLEAYVGGRIGIVGDGVSQFERVTVMTFESAYRRLDFVGDRFGLLIVDEVHHFASGARAEALEACAAPARLGLSATAPTRGSEGERRLRDLVGPIVLELSVADLAGKHLAAFEVRQQHVELTTEERVRYEKDSAPFIAARRAYFSDHRFATYNDMLAALGRTSQGRELLRGWASATKLAAFPAGKRALVRELLNNHRTDRTIIFTAHVEDVYTVAEDNLVPAITGEVGRREREHVLGAFREGKLRAIASARVLNEGIDVPDARVAIVVSGSLGQREHVQRIGRVLRPAPGKTALVYELVTRATVDERVAQNRVRAHRRGPGGPNDASA
jgi:superfamily II DNA or RNA helicase